MLVGSGTVVCWEQGDDPVSDAGDKDNRHVVRAEERGKHGNRLHIGIVEGDIRRMLSQLYAALSVLVSFPSGWRCN